ncbi:MAG TPA: peptidyl-prolyl cis-trans isomerase, partial [Prosthecobacter sp.]|nr:peptidyl-prolyl cis-trans isomerase [Prosthecobacter sp.]
PEPTYSDADLKAYYDAHIDLYLTDEQIRAAHITKGMQGAKSRTEIYEAMRKLRRRLQDGADFMTLAEQERADDQQQIDLGWFKRGEFMEEFETIAFSMNVGEISPVFNTQLGFHLCTVLERKAAEPKPFEEVREAVRQRMLEEHRDARFNAFLDQLKSTAEIKDTDPEESSCPGGH